MAHYAFLDAKNIVVNVIVGKDETPETDWEEVYARESGFRCKRTSYRTFQNEHPEGTPFRGNYASIGYTYNEELDAFLPPKTYDSWVLNMQDYDWEPQVAMPNDGMTYEWNEETRAWVYIDEPSNLLFNEPA